MAACYRVFPEHDLLVLRFGGHVTDAEYDAVMAAAFADPAHRPGMKQLADLSAMTSFRVDPVVLMKIEAAMLDILAVTPGEQMVVAIAPHPTALRAIEMVRRSWDGLDQPLFFRLALDAAQAAVFLGLETSIVADALRLTAEEGKLHD